MQKYLQLPGDFSMMVPSMVRLSAETQCTGKMSERFVYRLVNQLCLQTQGMSITAKVI